MMSSLRKIEKACKLLPPLLARDLKEKYVGSSIGMIWTVLQPLLLISLFVVVFAKIFKVRIPFGDAEMPFFIFLFSGLLPWFAIQEGIMRGATSVIEKGNLIKTVLYPPELFPITAVVSALVQHGIGFTLFLLWFFLVYRGDIAVSQVIGLPLLLSLQIMLTLGFAFLLSAFSVYVRDIVQILGVSLQGIFFLSPITYPLSSVPEELKWLILLNPFSVLIEAYHLVILYGVFHVNGSMIYLACTALFFFFFGLFVFRNLRKGFADVL